MKYSTGAILVVLAGVLWSAMGLSIRQLDAAGTWAVLFWRSVGMVPVLFGFIAWRSGGHPLQRLRRVGVAGVIGGLGLVFAFAGAIYAIQATTVANAVFLFAASPFLAAILGWILLREQVRLATWVAIGVAGVGMFIMVREGLAVGAMAGNIAALLSALGFAAFTITLRWGRLEDMMPAVVLGGVFSMAVAAIVLGVQGQGLAVSVHDGAIAMAMGAFQLATGMALYTLGSRVIPAAELTLLSMVEVLLAPIWVWLLMGETASVGTFIGGAVLMAAVAGNALSGARRGMSSAPAVLP
ncbi:MAG: DMT family transporter [Paracoccaceae bacterium]